MEDKDLDGLVEEFAVNGFPLDGDEFRETLRQHFGPVFNSLRERVKELEAENSEQHAKLTKACVEGGYNICARCGEAVCTDEMATIPAYRKKVENLEKEMEKDMEKAKYKIDISIDCSSVEEFERVMKTFLDPIKERGEFPKEMYIEKDIDLIEGDFKVTERS